MCIGLFSLFVLSQVTNSFGAPTATRALARTRNCIVQGGERAAEKAGPGIYS